MHDIFVQNLRTSYSCSSEIIDRLQRHQPDTRHTRHAHISTSSRHAHRSGFNSITNEGNASAGNGETAAKKGRRQLP